MAHVQYDFYNNVFAFLCRSLPSARPLSRAGGLGLGGAGSGDHLLVGGPSAALAAASATSVCSAPAALLWPQTQTPRTQVSALSVGVEVGGLCGPSCSESSTSRHVVSSFPFMADFDKNAEQGLIFFSVNFEFGNVSI